MNNIIFKGLSIMACVLSGISGFISKKDEIKNIERLNELEKKVSELMSKNE